MGKTLAEHIDEQKALEAKESKTEIKEETKEVILNETKEVTEVVKEDVKEEIKEEKKSEQPKKTWRELQSEFEAEEAERLELEDLKKLKDDAFVKEYRKILKTGGDVKAFVNAIADVDDSMLSDEFVFKNSPAVQGLDEAQRDEAWQEFKEQKDYIKANYIELEKAKFKQVIEEKRKAFGLTKSNNAPAPEVFTQAKLKLENLIDKITGTTIEDVFITEEMALELFKTAPKYFVSAMKDGEVDVSDAFETAFAKMAITTRKDDLLKQGETKGLEKAFKEKHNPNATQMVTPKSTQESTKEQEEEDAFDKRYGIKKR